MKPVLYIANVDEEGFENNPYAGCGDCRSRQRTARNSSLSVTSLEAEIAELEDAEKAEFLAELGMQEPGLDRVIRAGYRLLGLQTYFTAGVKEVRAWTVRQGKRLRLRQLPLSIPTSRKASFAPRSSAFDDFVAFNGESACAKDAGKWRLEGKEYLVQDGDVVHFRFNV